MLCRHRQYEKRKSWLLKMRYKLKTTCDIQLEILKSRPTTNVCWFLATIVV